MIDRQRIIVGHHQYGSNVLYMYMYQFNNTMYIEIGLSSVPCMVYTTDRIACIVRVHNMFLDGFQRACD